MEQWEKQGIGIKQHAYLPYAYVLEKTEGIKSMAGFEEGMFTVQDVSSMLVAHVAGIEKNMNIMDVCADRDLLSIEDLRSRAGLSKTVIEILRRSGVFKGLSQTNQVSLIEDSKPTVSNIESDVEKQRRELMEYSAAQSIQSNEVSDFADDDSQISMF